MIRDVAVDVSGYDEKFNSMFHSLKPGRGKGMSRDERN